MRDYLKNGSILELTAEKTSSKYVIEELCGQGTNCIVYEAHSLENDKKSRKVRIKEFYPSAAVARREENRLVWKTNPEKLKKGFLETYQKQIALQNNVMMGNTSAHIVDKIYEANDTLYIVVDVDYGWTFDQDAKHTNSLRDVLKTMIALSKTIKKYHDQGMLYLDIKPQNFLVLPETREMIKMIDTDTIIYKEDLFKGKVTSIPFSQGWAAPEQLQGKIRLISEQTDIYAIGAVLYERILGQRLTSKEINIHLEIPIENSIIKIENNNIKNSICAILKKALAVSPQKRYESIDVLIEAFSDVLEKSYKKMYLRDNCPASNIYFVGREDELEEIHEQFESGKNVVFLQGFGGIGKSELAKKYAEMYKESYEYRLFYPYYDSIDEVIKSIDIIGFEKLDESDQFNQSGQLERLEPSERSEQSEQSERSGQSEGNNKNRDEKKAKLAALKELCSKEKVLFILDNLDVEPEKAINLEEIVNLGAKVLITTRCDYDGYFENTAMQMKLDVLDRNELTEIFEHYYKSTLDSSEKEKIYEIFRKIDNYTLLVPIMAKYVSGAGITVSEFYEEFMEQSLSGYDEGTDKVRQIKDGTIYNATMMGHARRLFNIMSLKEEYKQVLVNLWYLDMYKMLDKKMYRRFTGSRNLNALNYMIEIGLVQENKTYYSSEEVKYLTIHPIIEELVETDIDHNPEQVQGI